MPELRIDPLSGLRVIVAGERSERPGAFPSAAPRPSIDSSSDPFAAGNEDRTPPELYRVPNEGDWQVRVVPNLYPALGDSAQSTSHDHDLFRAKPAEGAHEVIINSPEPVDSLLDLAADRLELAMGTWRERMRFHQGAHHRHLIVNEGKEAGASLAHTHAQLYALPFVPAAVARERERFQAYFEQTQGRNLLEDLLIEEIRAASRVVAVDSEAVAICPFASSVPFQVQVIPRKPMARFEDEGPLGASLLHGVLERLASVLGALPDRKSVV